MNLVRKYNYYKEMFVLNYDCKEYIFDTLEEVKNFAEINSIEEETVTLSDVGFIDNDNYEIIQDNETIIIN